MDPVSLGASAVAFLGVGIHAARALHAILSGIKDGPENVKRASDSVWGLVPILEDLARRRALGQDGKAVLERRLLMCVEDLEGFASKIDRISLSDSERRRGKYWKKVRMVFSEKALATMCAVTSGHVAAINLQLNVMSSDAVFAMPDQLNEIKQAVLAQRTDGAESLAALINQKATIGELLTEVSRIGNGVDTVQQTITTLTAARLTTNDETRDMVHQILRLAMGLSAGEEGIQVLLDRGFDIHDSDEDGRTPLQNCFNGNVHLGEFTSNPRWIGASRVRSLANGIITLIQHGADIHGIDYLGHSVSHKAYHPKHGDSGLWDDDGSLRGDLWDYALTMCGYDISEFGGAYCRRARYTKRYRRADFEALWEGNEHLCPYFNSRKCRCARHSLGQEMDDSSDWVSTSEDEDECEMGDYEEHDWESEVCSSLSWDSEYEDQLSSDSESDGSDMDHNCIDQEDTSSDASESGWETDDSESGPTL
ncbi:unnamed protein product [Parascedosporium putredinis]|uniref:Azaphilone pigments biosynthesis cluster protein L N-terminal domain-containing protein n=1 Tax=Parascedosporium putredinis TaxID=1442378 RepID=A0A9P1M8X6_9PEZI|nr:unnamed protein product [Parascedosporium putredinis]CAI7990747.1 unnamed protein product [Parascedosporium putredinis]